MTMRRHPLDSTAASDRGGFDLRRRRMLMSWSAAALGLAGVGARAQSAGLPALGKIYVGFPPGGAPDIVARRLADLLQGKLATTMVVENRPGAGGRIALDGARQTPPDGLTLLLSPAGIVTTNPHTYRKLNYDPFKDLAPITLTHTISIAFAVGPAVPDSVQDLKGFAAWARAQSAPVTFGSPAAGAPPHFVGDWLGRSLNLNLTHVPYRGGAPAFNDLFGGSISGLALTAGDFVKHVEGKRLRVIGVTGSKRNADLPNVGTFAEQGVKGLERDDWFGLYIAGNPTPELVQRLSSITREVQTGEAYRRTLRENYLEPAWSTPQELERRGREDHAHWAPIIKASGFVADA
jgi:tripartite-type tricarboxylate transporter receptor subunit TctC